MLDPKTILAEADAFVAANDQWAALPSTDLAIRATLEATCAAINAFLAPIAAALEEQAAADRTGYVDPYPSEGG